MSNNSFKIKNALTLTPVNPADIPNPVGGDVISDITDSNKIKRYDVSTSAWVPMGGAQLKGQADSVASDVASMQVPNYQATSIGSESFLIETGNNNLLINPSFEAPLAGGVAPGWTSPDATLAIETTDAFHGKQALKATYSAKPVNLYQSSTLNASAFVNGVNGVRSIAVKTSIAYTSTLKIYVCGVYAGVLKATSDGTSITDCKEVNNNGSWGEYVYSSTLGATSNGIAVVSLNPTTGDLVNVTGDVFIDKAEVSQTNRVGIAPVDTDTVSFTPVFSVGSGSITNYTTSGKWYRVGEFLHVEANLYFNGSPGSWGSSLNIALPPNLTIDSSKLAGSVSNVGSLVIHDASPTANLPSSAVYVVSPDSITLQYSTIQTHTGSPPLAGLPISSTSPIAFASGDYINVNFKVPIVGWSSSTSYLADTASSFSTNTNPLYFKATAIVDSDPVGTFNTYSYAINTNTKTICGTAPTQSISDMKANGIQIFTRAYNADSTCGNPARVEVKIGKGMQDVQKLLYKDTSKSSVGSLDYIFTATTDSRGAGIKEYSSSSGVLSIDSGFQSSATISIALFIYSDVSTQNNGYLVINAQKAKDTMVAEITDMAKSEGSGGVDIQSVYFGSGADCTSPCTTGTCTICRKIGNKITSVEWFNVGASYRIYGLDRDKYICSGTGSMGSFIYDYNSSTSTRVSVYGGTTSSSHNHITCIGTK